MPLNSLKRTIETHCSDGTARPDSTLVASTQLTSNHLNDTYCTFCAGRTLNTQVTN